MEPFLPLHSDNAHYFTTSQYYDWWDCSLILGAASACMPKRMTHRPRQQPIHAEINLPNLGARDRHSTAHDFWHRFCVHVAWLSAAQGKEMFRYVLQYAVASRPLSSKSRLWYLTLGQPARAPYKLNPALHRNLALSSSPALLGPSSRVPDNGPHGAACPTLAVMIETLEECLLDVCACFCDWG